MSKAKTQSAVKTIGNKVSTAVTTGKNIITKNPVQTAYVVAGVVALYLTYKVTTKASDTIDNIFDGDNNVDNSVNGTGQGSVKNATITDAQAINFASQLLSAMNHMAPFYGTDEKTIETVFDKLTNGDDFLKIYRVFGMKDYNGNGSPVKGFWNVIDLFYDKRNLVYWLKAEVSPFTDRKLFNKIKNIVQQAGFTF